MGPQCQGCARGTSSQTCTGSAWHITRVTRATDSPVLHLSPASKGGPRAGKGQDRHP
jgi:urease alpha subunit